MIIYFFFAKKKKWMMVMLRENQRQFLQFLDDPKTRSWKWINLYGTVEGKSWIGQYIKRYKSDKYEVYEWEDDEDSMLDTDVFRHDDNKQRILISIEPIRSEKYHQEIVFYHMGINRLIV